MPYRLKIQSSFEKDAKFFKNNHELKKEIAYWISRIVQTPEIGELLKGSWEGYRKIGFHTKPQVRIIYRLYPCCTDEVKEAQICRFESVETESCAGLVDFIFVRTREDCNNLYAKSKKYSEGFLRE